MIRQKTSDSAIQVTVTSTATSLKDLLDTANGSALEFPEEVNAIELNAEGDVRYSTAGTPTISKGMKLNSGETRILRGTTLNQIKMIASSNTLVNVEIGYDL
jgi:hypothetical protein